MNYEKLIECRNFIAEKVKGSAPKIAVVLGSGLGGFADNIEDAVSVSYAEAGLASSQVSGHKNRFVFGRLDGVEIVAMQGRLHFYEGISMSDVIAPVRILHMLGVDTIIFTNASGGINTEFKAGDLMIITDHIMTVQNPLMGENIAELGERFPDMSEPYDKSIVHTIESEAKLLGIDIKKGVYIQVSGPSYETPAEVKAYGKWGADAVGMSTACEVVACKHMKMRVGGISTITNMASGVTPQKLDHSEVLEVGKAVGENLSMLLKNVVKKLDN